MRVLAAISLSSLAKSGETLQRVADISRPGPLEPIREVQTKFSKSFETTFFPVGNDVVVDWVNYLRRDKLWGLDDPLFAATKVAVGDNLRFKVKGLARKH